MASGSISDVPVKNIYNCTNAAFRNYFGYKQYECAESFFGGKPPLSLASAYVIVLAFGVVFGMFTVGIVYLEHYITGRPMSSEFFNTAGRDIKKGLTASVIVSQWTWAATLLQSSNVAYKYGISGPFWYAAGATIQVILFSLIAVLVKRRAPTCHTFLEIIQARWGKTAHMIFTLFGLMTNMVVTAMLILGSSAVIHALTGMNTDLASFLIPLGVIIYTVAGGLKATFVASYFNTAVIMIALVIFTFKVYVVGGGEIGSPAKMWYKLTEVVKIDPVAGNYHGSYLTMLSRNGFFFGLVNIVGNFGTVFVDQSYWQGAIAATPTASWKGYLLGGLCWFAIPFSLSTSLGLASVALSLPVTAKEAGDGLVPPAVAKHLMGNGGSILILIMLFMAVTSTGAAELIAVSSIVAYDIYRAYINPAATGKQIVNVSRIVIVIFGLFMGVLGIILNKIGIGLGWLYLFMGVLIGSAVFPVAFSICWSKCSRAGAISGVLGGAVLGLGSWLAYAGADGGVSVENTGRDEIMLTGNLMAILGGGAISVIVSLMKPDNCDWTSTKSIPLIENDPHANLPVEEQEDLERAMKRISMWGFGLTIVLVILWPVFTLPVRAFPKGYFIFWVIISLIWGLLSTITLVFLPVWESRRGIIRALLCQKYIAEGDERDVVDEKAKAAAVDEIQKE